MTAPTSIGLFPQPLPGWTFDVVRAPKFAQRKSRAVSGRTLRVLDQIYPVYEWTLTYDVLREKNDVRVTNPPWNFTEFRKLAGFYVAMNGSFGPFLFFDPTDGQVTGQQIGVGDGTTTVFYLGRGLSSTGLFEPIHAAIWGNDATLKALTGLTGTIAFNIYANGVLQTDPTDYHADAHVGWGSAVYAVTFTSPPGSGVVITVDMTYLWPVTFAMDAQEFNNFLINRWGVRQLKLESFLIP